jgi:bacteriocin-like protein
MRELTEQELNEVSGGKINEIGTCQDKSLVDQLASIGRGLVISLAVIWGEPVPQKPKQDPWQ